MQLRPSPEASSWSQLFAGCWGHAAAAVSNAEHRLELAPPFWLGSVCGSCYEGMM